MNCKVFSLLVINIVTIEFRKKKKAKMTELFFICSLYTVHKNTREWIEWSYPKPTRDTPCTMKIFTKVCGVCVCVCVYIQPINANCWSNSCGIALTPGNEAWDSDGLPSGGETRQTDLSFCTFPSKGKTSQSLFLRKYGLFLLRSTWTVCPFCEVNSGVSSVHSRPRNTMANVRQKREM